MITSSGAKCDVCGKWILPIDPDELVHTFSVKGIDQKLHCDNKCKQKLIDCGNDWQELPDGPLKTVFQATFDKIQKGEK